MSKVVDAVGAVLPRYAAECGVEIVDVEYKKGFNGMELIIFIDCDNPGGVSLEDCERLHRAIDPVLDELDPTDGQPYQLSVSSPGLDRPIKTERDYRKNLGKEVSVSLFKKIGELKKFIGVLKSYDFDNGKIIVEIQEKKELRAIELNIKDIALIKPEIRFD